MCVCVLGDLSLIFLYCSSSTMVFIPLARPRHYLGRGLQISGQFLRHQSAIGQLETDAVAEGFRRLRQEKSSTAISKLSAEPALASTAPDALEGSSAHSSVSNTAGERERDVNTPQPLEFESWEGVPESRQAHSPSSSPMLVHRFISAALT